MLFEVPGLSLGAPKTDSKKTEMSLSNSDSKQIQISNLNTKNNGKIEQLIVMSSTKSKNKVKANLKSNEKDVMSYPYKDKKVAPQNNVSSKTNSQKIEKQSGKTKLQQKMEEKLRGARFRYLNQKLYQSDSLEALNHFKEHPEDFQKVF